MSIDITYLRLKRAIEKNSECFLCDLESELEQRYLKNYLEELVMDPKAREKIIQSRGFCNSHSYKILFEANKPTNSDGHGIALIMKSITEHLIQQLPSEKYNARYNFFKMLVHAERCPACIHLDNFMKMYIEKAVGLIAASGDFSKLFKESKGMCIPHFILLTSATKGLELGQVQIILEVLYDVEGKNLQRVNADLAEYVRRQSYEFSEKDRAEVAGILLRSIEKIAGRRGLTIQGRS